jgi:hypothetical protein
VTNDRSGLETWTLRPGWTRDAGIPEPMVIGLQPFISLKKIVLAGDSVILLSKYAPVALPLVNHMFVSL